MLNSFVQLFYFVDWFCIIHLGDEYFMVELTKSSAKDFRKKKVKEAQSVNIRSKSKSSLNLQVKS